MSTEVKDPRTSGSRLQDSSKLQRNFHGRHSNSKSQKISFIGIWLIDRLIDWFVQFQISIIELLFLGVTFCENGRKKSKKSQLITNNSANKFLWVSISEYDSLHASVRIASLWWIYPFESEENSERIETNQEKKGSRDDSVKLTRTLMKRKYSCARVKMNRKIGTIKAFELRHCDPSGYSKNWPNSNPENIIDPSPKNTAS